MIKPHNLLIVRTDRIGDVVLSLPLAPVIKKYYPGCRITFLMREYTRTLAEGNPYIDEILLLKTEGDKVSLTDNVKAISSKKFDTAIIVYPTFITSLILFLGGIRYRIGTGYRWYSFLFNKKIFEHRKYAEKHELEYNFSLLSVLGIYNINQKDKTGFHLRNNPSVASEVRRILEQRGVDLARRIIIVHPGSGGSSVDLPVDKYRELIGRIIHNYDCEIIVTGSRSEADKCQKLVVSPAVKNFAGSFDLAQLVSVIDFSVLFISNSTGPLHIAAALGKHIIGFYPKVKACSAERWGPYSDKGHVFTPEIDCSNCTVEQCLKLDCMNSIDLNKVFDKIQKILMLLPDTGDKDAK